MRILAPDDVGPSGGSAGAPGPTDLRSGDNDPPPIVAEVFARALALAAEEAVRTGETIGRRTGLSAGDLRSIVERLPHLAAVIVEGDATACDNHATSAGYTGYKPASTNDTTGSGDDSLSSFAAADDDEEEAQVRLLLHRHRAADTDDHTRLAKLVARRAMEPNHLWQDLGLAARADLKALLEFAFPELAGRNTTAMRWKKFFYRQLCEAEGFVLCTAPSCGVCRDFADCFGPEDGETLLATLRRTAEASV